MVLTFKYQRHSIIVGIIFVVLNCILIFYLLQHENNNWPVSRTLTLKTLQEVFSGEKIRTYQHKGFEVLKGKKLYMYKDVSQRYTSSCQFWAVVTTIFPPSAAVRKVVKVCLEII